MRDFNDIIEQTSRMNRRTIEPLGVRTGMIGDIIGITSVATGTATLSNGDQTLFTATFTSANSTEAMAEIHTAIYVDSEAAANELPGGSGIDESQWQIIGNFHPLSAFNGEDYITRVRVYIRNISAGASKAVIFKAQSKFFRPAGADA